MNVDAPGLLLGALLGAEVAAVGLAVRSFGFDQGVADHLRKLVSMLRKAAQKLTRAGDVAVVERAANVKHDGFEVGGHTGSIGGASESRQRNRTLLALLAFALAEARDRACALRDRPPTDPHLVAVEIAAIGDLLEKAIGGPTDPNTPAGG